MNPISSRQKFRKILFWFTTIFLGIHILLCSLCVFFKVDFLPGKLNSFYTKLVVLGPFFQQDRIATSPHLYISTFSTSTGWSSGRDIANDFFLDFQQHPWRYEKLKWSNYERYILRKAYEKIYSLEYIDGSEGEVSAELLRYANFRTQSASDSIKLVYTWNEWQPQTRSFKIDTAFNVVFKPRNSGAVK